VGEEQMKKEEKEGAIFFASLREEQRRSNVHPIVTLKRSWTLNVW